MKTTKELASELQQAFVTGKRNDGAEYVHLKDGSREEIAATLATKGHIETLGYGMAKSQEQERISTPLPTAPERLQASH